MNSPCWQPEKELAEETPMQLVLWHFYCLIFFGADMYFLEHSTSVGMNNTSYSHSHVTAGWQRWQI